MALKVWLQNYTYSSCIVHSPTSKRELLPLISPLLHVVIMSSSICPGVLAQVLAFIDSWQAHKSSFYHPVGWALSSTAEGNAGRQARKKQVSKQATAFLSAAHGWVRCYWELTEQGVECEAGIWISVCFTTLCCLIRKSGLVASLGKRHSPARKLPCSGSLHEYWLMMPFWGYRYLAKWKRLSCIARKSQRNSLSQPFPSTAVLQSQAGAEIFEKWRLFDPAMHAFH